MRRVYIFLTFLCCQLSIVQAQMVLRLKTTVEVSSRDVLLGDLVVDAKVIPTDWRTRRVMTAPAAGEVSYHAITAVAYGLARYEDMKRITLSGEPVISISRRDRKVEKEEFYEPLLSYLKTTEPWKDSDVDVDILSVPSKARIPVGKTTYSVTRIDERTSTGQSQAYVVVNVDGVREAELQIGIAIQLLTKVWVVAQNLERGHILQEGDLRSELHEVDSTGNYVASREDLLGYEVNRSVSAGSLLRRNVVSKPLCAKRGEWVAINALSSSLHITLRGKAMANGRLGDRIMCVNERSQRQVLVELVGAGNGVLVRL